MNHDAPLVASLALAILGGAIIAIIPLTLGYAPLIAALAYSFGGAGILLLSALSIAALWDQSK
jgi:hypothetical protein